MILVKFFAFSCRYVTNDILQCDQAEDVYFGVSSFERHN